MIGEITGMSDENHVLNQARADRMPVFAERFAQLRGEMSQRQFADFLGISRSTIGFYENGSRLPDAATLKVISKKCDVSIDWLLGVAEQNDKTKPFLLYKIWYGDECVYIGRTKQPLQRRLHGHFFSAPHHKTLDPRAVTKIEYATLKSCADMYLYEIYYINLLKPALNRDDKAQDALTIRLQELTWAEFDCQHMERWRRELDENEMAMAEKKQRMDTLFQEAQRMRKLRAEGKASDEEYFAVREQYNAAAADFKGRRK